MFIKLTSIESDKDMAPIAEVPVLINMESITSIFPIDSNTTAATWTKWNKTMINFVNERSAAVKQSIDEIESILSKNAQLCK